MTEIIPQLEYVTIKRSEYDYLRAVVENDWQPIETAPKDQRKHILVAYVMSNGIPKVTEAFWNVDAGYNYQERRYEGRWWCFVGGIHEDVTHWMPLPEPPRGDNG